MRKEITYTIEGWEVEEILNAEAWYEHYTIKEGRYGVSSILGATVKQYRKSNGEVIDLKTAKATVIKALRERGVIPETKVSSEIKASHSWGAPDIHENIGSVYSHKMIISLRLEIDTKSSEEGNLLKEGNLKTLIKLQAIFDDRAQLIMEKRMELLYPDEEVSISRRELVGFTYTNEKVYIDAYGHEPDEEYMTFPASYLFDENWMKKEKEELRIKNQTEEERIEAEKKEQRRQMYLNLKQEFE